MTDATAIPKLTEEEAAKTLDALSEVYMEGAIWGLSVAEHNISKTGHSIESSTFDGELPESMNTDDKEQGLDMLAMALGIVTSCIEVIEKRKKDGDLLGQHGSES